jgi:predicted small secreted protein
MRGASDTAAAKTGNPPTPIKQKPGVRATRSCKPAHNLVNSMITFIKRLTLLLTVTAVLAFAATGCNTAHGFGKDMEAAGDKIQEKTD